MPSQQNGNASASSAPKSSKPENGKENIIKICRASFWHDFYCGQLDWVHISVWIQSTVV